MPHRQVISEGLSLVFQGIERLKMAFPYRQFTIDGRLVGDIGEIIAQLEYGITLHGVSQPGHDGVTPDGRNVQVKATFKNSLTFSTTPDYYLGFKLYPDGHFEEVYNGPGQPIYERFAHRAGIGSRLLSFPLKELRVLSATVPNSQRVLKRTSRDCAS